MLVEPARGVVVRLETDRALAFRAFLRAAMRQLLLPGHGQSLAAHYPSLNDSLTNPGGRASNLLRDPPTIEEAMEPTEVARLEGSDLFQRATATADRFLENIETVVHGKRDEVKLVFAAMICGGHVLFEDVPGTAKTVLARAM